MAKSRVRTQLLLPDEAKFAKPSFSQCGEDLILRHLFDQLGIARPTYLDVGAHHPQMLSNTALFSATGSTGINVEPDPELFAAFPPVDRGTSTSTSASVRRPGT